MAVAVAGGVAKEEAAVWSQLMILKLKKKKKKQRGRVILVQVMQKMFLRGRRTNTALMMTGQLGGHMMHGAKDGMMTLGMHRLGHGIHMHTTQQRAVSMICSKPRQKAAQEHQEQAGARKKTPQQTPKNIDDVKDEPAPRKVDAKKDNKDTNKGKKRPKNEPNEAEVAPSERKNRHVCGSVFRTPLPATKKDRHQEVMDFLKSFKTMPEDAATKLMRGRLHDVACCRLNVYYNRPAVGLHCRVDKRDIAYFRAASTDCPYVFRLASSMKAAEMMVPCLHLHLHI